MCTNRILVQESILEAFTEKFVKAVGALRLGNGLDRDVNVGPMISTSALDEVKQLVVQSLNAGTRLLTGGEPKQSSCFYQATVLANVTNEMLIAANEIFGPVALIISFKSEQKALEIANDTE